MIQLCQKLHQGSSRFETLAGYRGDIALNRAEIAEWFTRAILKLRLQDDNNALSCGDKNRLCKRAFRKPRPYRQRERDNKAGTFRSRPLQTTT